jgi:hypothetical protein
MGSGWENGNIVFNVTIISVPGGPPALLVYAGAPAAGNLIISLSATAGSDAFGNNFPAGFRVGEVGQAAIVLGFAGTAGVIFFPGVVANVLGDANIGLNHQGAGNAAQSFLTISSATDNLQLDRVASNWFESSHDGTARSQISEAYIDPGGSAHFYRHLSYAGCVIDAGSITAVDPTTGTSSAAPAAAETWHAVAFANLWANFAGHQAVRYRKSPENRVWLDGDAAPGTWINGTIVFTLPVGYRPLALHSIIKQTEGNGAGTFSFDIDTDGTVKVNDIVGAVPPITDFTGISFPLD